MCAFLHGDFMCTTYVQEPQEARKGTLEPLELEL